MALKKYHVSKNILNPESTTTNTQGEERYGDEFPAGTYYIYNGTGANMFWRDGISSTQGITIAALSDAIVTSSDTLVVWYSYIDNRRMVAASSVAVPFELYGNNVWEDAPCRKQCSATETITSGDTIYANGQPISTYTIKGNTTQSGTPSPSAPISVNGVGELETTGEHSGEYKIPILTPQGSAVNYLGSVQSNRQIQKLVLTGQENWTEITGNKYWMEVTDYRKEGMITACTHYKGVTNGDGSSAVSNGEIAFYSSINNRMIICDSAQADLSSFTAFLASEYAAGTPVTVWYVLATATTGVVNEPLMKIGDYSDSISNATAIPTTDGANTITVDTTVQPSEFTATWTGWHDAEVKEKSENLLSFDELNSAPSGELTSQTSGSTYTMPHVLELTLEPNTTYTLSSNYNRTIDKQNIVYLQYADSAQSPNTSTSPTATTDNTGKVKIGFYDDRIGSDEFLNGSAWLMLNSGSTAQTYEPYWK